MSPSPGRRAGMELKVEAVEGFSLPNNCFIGVRVGDVLKQGRYEPHRCYHFPQLERRRNAKVDIYQHVGTCIVAVDPDTRSSHEVAVTSMDPSLPGSRIRVNVEAKMEDGKANREERAKALKVQARDYLTKHNIEVRLSEAVKALLKEQPADPTSFFCTHLRGAEAEAAKEPPSAPAPAEPQEPVEEDPGCQITEDDELNAIRKQGRDAFLQASEDGSLEQALRGLRPGLSEPPAEEAAPQEPTEEEKKKAHKDAVRAKASNVLIAAAENGELERALTLVKKDSVVQGSEDGKRESNASAVGPPVEAKQETVEAPAEVQEQSSQELRPEAAELPSEASESGKPETREAAEELKPRADSATDIPQEPPTVMVRDLAVTAPAFVSFGIQPGLQFI